MNPLYMSPTGTKILGADAKYVHDYVADEDIGSEYPTSACITNLCNETLVGKVFLDDEDDIELPIYNNFQFLGNEKKKYKVDISNSLIENLSERQVIEVGHVYLNLPNLSDILEIIESNKEEYLNG